MIFDRREVRSHDPDIINNMDIELVSSLKYLGVYLELELTHSLCGHIECVCGHLVQRMPFLRRLRLFGVSIEIMLDVLYCCSGEHHQILYAYLVWYTDCST